MRIGVTGHQYRPGIDWPWITAEINNILVQEPAPLVGLSSLAIGTDQLFARLLLSQGAKLISIIPLDNYDRYFSTAADLAVFHELLTNSEVIRLARSASDEDAFFKAGRKIVDSCDLLIAVWDGKPAEGLGGTADVVNYAHQIGRPVVHIDPFLKTVNHS